VWRRADAPEWLTVVGVVEDVKQLGPAQKSHAAVYQPYVQVQRPFLLSDMTYVVRTASDPAAAIPAIRQVLRSVDRDQPAVAIGPMSDLLDRATADPAFYTRLLTIFALLALALSLVGVYGVMAYSVAQRTHEIAVRMALGARDSRVIWMVLRRTVILGASGAIIGMAGAWACARFLQSFLFEIAPTDPATFTAVTLTVVATAVMAGVIPARRATRVDPLMALRSE
jgi:putative ABC transport system permease protein